MPNQLLIKGISLEGKSCDLYIKGERIEKIAPTIEPKELESPLYEEIDGRGKAVIPGLINMHTHTAMTLMRGIGEDMELKNWLEKRIWPIEEKLNDELIYWGTKLAMLEMVKSGTTTFNDQYWRVDVAQRAVSEMGLRSLQPFVILDLGDKRRAEEIKEQCYRAWEQSKGWGELNRFAIALHAPYSVSEEMLVWGAQFARERDLLIHLHLSETEEENIDSIYRHGVTPTAYLERLGILGPDVIAAHALWMESEDMEIIAKRGVKVVHNVNSNLKIASGYQFRYKEFKERGVVVSLGTDGCASSNNLDLLEAMKSTALLQKGWRRDATILPLEELMELATVNGAISLRLNSGVVEEGALADLTIVDIDNYAFTPNINFLANLIYSANSSVVDSVICNGKIVMRERMVEGEEEIIREVNRLYKSLLK